MMRSTPVFTVVKAVMYLDLSARLKRFLSETVQKMAEASGIYTLDELKQKNIFRFWDRFLILCEHYHIAADSILQEYSSELAKEYLLSLKYGKEPDTTRWKPLCR